MATLSYPLQKHIEFYIDQIEQGHTFYSILNCPLDILEEYLNVLKMVEVAPKEMCYPYIDIALYLARVTDSGQCVNMSGTPDHVVYEFQFGLRLFDYEQTQMMLRTLCPHHRVTVESMSSDVTLGTTTLKIRVEES